MRLVILSLRQLDFGAYGVGSGPPGLCTIGLMLFGPIAPPHYTLRPSGVSGSFFLYFNCFFNFYLFILKLIKCKFILKDREFIGAFEQAESGYYNSQHV